MTDASAAQEAVTPEAGQSHRDASIVLVKNYTLASLAPAVLPLPLVDLAVLSGVQLKMLHALSQLYGLEFSTEISRAAIASLVTSVLPVAASPVMASLVKFIPGVGQAAGVASMLVLGGASTHALGMVFVRHFEDGGDFTNFDAQVAKAYFQEEFEKGKQIALELKDKAKAKIRPSTTDSSPAPHSPST